MLKKITHKITKNGHFHETIIKQNFPIIFNFIENQHMQGHEALRNPFSHVFLFNPAQNQHKANASLSVVHSVGCEEILNNELD